MSTGYELDGRSQQKQRTRKALVDAARALVDEGRSPTVEEAAAAALISRTTAYRYFSGQADLLAAAYPSTAATSLLPPNPPDDPEARVAIVVNEYTKTVLTTEAQQRTMLRLSLAATDDEGRRSLPLRQGRVIGWLVDALEPARAQLGDAGIRRAAVAIRSASGIEAMVWLIDIAGLSQREAIKVMRANAMAICRAALDDA